MKVSMTCGRSPLECVGGIEAHVTEVSRRLCIEGIDVKVLSTSTHLARPYYCFRDGVRYELFPAIAPHEIYYFSPALYQGLSKENSQILHAHGYQDFSFLAALKCKKKEQKLFVTIHSGYPSTYITSLFNRYYSVLIRRLLRRADKILGVSKSDLELLGFDLADPANAEKLAVIPNGIDLSDFEEKHALPKSVPEENKFILSIARLEKYKGHQFVIESYAQLKKLRRARSSSAEVPKLVIVGSGAYRGQLERLIRRSGLKKDILILTNLSREQIIALYQRCELFVLLSRFESYGLAVADAIAAQKPVIVTLTSALRDFVLKGYCMGVNYPPRKEVVAELMDNALENSDRFIPQNVKLYTWDRVVADLKRLYKETLEQ